MSTENMFQYTIGTSGLRGCKECCQEEHEWWRQGQWTHTQRSDTYLFSCFHILPLSCFLMSLQQSLSCAYIYRYRLFVLAHPLHTTRSTRDHLDCAPEVWLWRWPGAHTGIPFSFVSAELKLICWIMFLCFEVALGTRWMELSEQNFLLNQQVVLFDDKSADQLSCVVEALETKTFNFSFLLVIFGYTQNCYNAMFCFLFMLKKCWGLLLITMYYQIICSFLG